MKNNAKEANEKPMGSTQIEILSESERFGRCWVIPEETPGVALLQAILGHARQAHEITSAPTGFRKEALCRSLHGWNRRG